MESTRRPSSSRTAAQVSSQEVSIAKIIRFLYRIRPSIGAGYTGLMRTFSLLFAFIALVMLAMFLIYVLRGPVDPLIAGGLFVSFLACLAPALLLLKPFEPPEELRRRREEARKEREKRQNPTGGDDSGEEPSEDRGS